MLVASYFDQKELFPEYVGKNVVFDFSGIREAGAQLSSSSGKAPGPEPLKKALSNIKKVLDFGCGIGRYFKHYKKFYEEVHGYDLPSMVDRCKVINNEKINEIKEKHKYSGDNI